MKLNLGCCDRLVPGFIGVDLTPPDANDTPDLYQQVDLAGPWPWETSSVDEILAYDVIEHLPDKIQTMNELWRVLKPGGLVHIQVPHATRGDGGHCDPTHESYWTTSDFEYYHPGFLERERFRRKGKYARIIADFIVRKMDTTQHGRRWGGTVVEIQATLEAVK